MAYYLHIKDEKIVGKGQAKVLNLINIEVSKDIYDNLTDYIYSDGKVIINPNLEKIKIEKRKTQFNKDFFQTSLGYIRRKVTMKTGETKDFLSDLLPVISMGVNSGQEVTIIAYKEPDFTQEITDWETLQEKVIVNATFIQECFNRLSVDFTG